MSLKPFLNWIETPAAAAGVDLRPLLTWPFLLLAGAIVGLALGGMSYTFHRHKDEEIARFQAIVDLKVNQIAAWFQERDGDARILRGSPALNDLYRRWRDASDSASREQLRRYLGEYRRAYAYRNVLLFDERGEPVLAAADAPLHVAPELRATIRRAVAEGRVLHTDPYRRKDDPTAIHLDFVVPLVAADGRAGPTVVLCIDPTTGLYSSIRSWPFPSASAEIEIVRRDGDQVLFLGALRHRPDAAPQLRLPVGEPRLLAARLLRGESAPGRVVEGLDYRGMPAMGVGQAVSGTDWFLLGKLDRDELYAPALRDAAWVALMGVMVLAVAAVATVLGHQRQREAEQSRAMIERAAAADALRRHQTMLARTEGIAHIGSWEWQVATDIVTWSDELFRIFRRDPADGAPTFAEHPELYDPDDMRRLRAAVEAAVNEGTPYELELRAIRQDGAIRVCLACGQAEMGPEQRATRLFGSFQDITERKRAEDEVKRYQHIISSTPDAIALLDSDYRYRIVNRAYERFSGIDKDQFVGRTIADYLGQDAFELHIKPHFDRCLRGETISFEDWFDYKTIGKRYVAVTYFPYRGEDGTVTGIVAVTRDMTERRRVEQQLEMTQFCTDEAALAIFWLDAEDRVLYANAQACRSLGYSLAELQAMRAWDIDPEFPESRSEPFWREIRQTKVAHFESTHRRKDGSTFPVALSIKYAAYRGEEYNFAFAQDITERKRADEKLRAALEQKTVLLKEVHHRVKNNLQIVTSLLNLQARQVQNPAVLAALQDTQGRIRSMALLHETLYREGDPGRIDGAAYLAHLCAHLSGAFGAMAGRVRLRHRLAPVTLALDQAVPCGLIVNELVSNAFKHAFSGERGGEIRVELDAEIDGRLALVVADDGVGLPPGLNPEQSDTLGLQLVAGLARQLGGAVETGTDAGTAFRVAFPGLRPGETSSPS